MGNKWFGWKECYGCYRQVPEYWAIPFCTLWRGDVPSKSQYEFIPATCPICCDKEITLAHLVEGGLTWGGLRN